MVQLLVYVPVGVVNSRAGILVRRPFVAVEKAESLRLLFRKSVKFFVEIIAVGVEKLSLDKDGCVWVEIVDGKRSVS
jgi:hypothetical protein